MQSKKGLNVLSVFDGMSCGRIALERAGIKVDKYYSSEIKEYAIQVSKANYPDIIQLGDITKIDSKQLPKIDIIMGGSPCQDISNLSSQGKGLQGSKSSLFFEFLRLLQEVKPTYFLLENVVGNKKSIQEISSLLGVVPIMINSSLLTAQKRKRYYWTNIPNIVLPIERNIQLLDILEDGVDEKYYLKDGRLKWLLGENGQKCIAKRYASLDPIKANCLTRRSDASWNCNYITQRGRIRRLTPKEYERLQTVPDNYTMCIPDRHRYDVLGDGWTVDVIAHILRGIK